MAECFVLPILTVAQAVTVAEPTEPECSETGFTLAEAEPEYMPEATETAAAPLEVPAPDPLQLLIEDLSGITGALREPMPQTDKAAPAEAQPKTPEATLASALPLLANTPLEMPRQAAPISPAEADMAAAETTRRIVPSGASDTKLPETQVAEAPLDPDETDLLAAEKTRALVPPKALDMKPVEAGIEKAASDPDGTGLPLPETTRQIFPLRNQDMKPHMKLRETQGDTPTPAPGQPDPIPVATQRFALSRVPDMPSEKVRIDAPTFDLVQSDVRAVVIEPMPVDPAAGSIPSAARGETILAESRPVRTTTFPVARQIAEAVVTAKEDLIEIALAPEELGRIRIVMSGPDQAAPHVTVWVERPEVLDQLRRNAAVLHECLADAGMSDASFEFQGDTPSDSRSGHQAAPLAGRRAYETMETVPSIPVAWTPMAIPARLDIRI